MPTHCPKNNLNLHTKAEPAAVGADHRRRIVLEDKAKVIASDWGTESLPC